MNNIPKPPTLHYLTERLKYLHEAVAHSDAGIKYVRLICLHDGRGFIWTVAVADEYEGYAVAINDQGNQYVSDVEVIPGTGRLFDAIAAARRLLASVPE